MQINRLSRLYYMRLFSWQRFLILNPQTDFEYLAAYQAPPDSMHCATGKHGQANDVEHIGDVDAHHPHETQRLAFVRSGPGLN